MVNYANSKIYKIYPITGEDECYIGSTVNTLCRRMTGHRTVYNCLNNQETSKILFNKYGIENCKIQLLELWPCDTKEQLHAREAYHIRNNNCVNKKIPLRTAKEYRQNNKELIAERNKQYIQDNKESIAEHKKNYYESNKTIIAEKAKQYREANKEIINEKAKQYRETNKEVIAEKAKQYREVNKEIINEKAKIKVKCICGVTVRKSDLTRHKKCKHHLQDEQDFFDGCEQALLELNNNL
jgi:hypothetical protein